MGRSSRRPPVRPNPHRKRRAETFTKRLTFQGQAAAVIRQLSGPGRFSCQYSGELSL